MRLWGIGCLGVAVGLVILLLSPPPDWLDDRLRWALWFCEVFCVPVGLGLLGWRYATAIDPLRSVVVSEWRIFAPLQRRRVAIKNLTHLELRRIQFRAGVTSYVLVTVGADPQITLITSRSQRFAREQARRAAQAAQLPLEDLSDSIYKPST